jgi:hypothetical protein
LIKKKSYKKSFYLSVGSLLVLIPLLFASFYFNFEHIRIFELYYFTFIFLLFFTTLFFSIIFSLKQLRDKKRLELILIFSTLFIYVLYGILNANNFVVKEINLESDKINAPLKFIQISDVHIGSEHSSYLDKIVDKINGIEKDFVVITGDLLDEENVEYSHLESLNKLNVPVYLVMGNHEIFAKKQNNFFEELNLVVLHNEKIAFNEEFDIIGINFYNPDGSFDALNVSDILDDIEINNSKYNLILNHEAEQLDPVIDKKIDLQLSGHTHNGQIWPFNYLVRLRYKYIYGLYALSEDTSLYVSSGIGTWGPNIRVGSRNEIVLFGINPEGY